MRLDTACLPFNRIFMYASSLSVAKPSAAARIFARVLPDGRGFRVITVGVLALIAACNDAPTVVGRSDRDVQLAVAANVLANPGAVLVAEVSYTAIGGTRALFVLARDSLVITTGAADTPMSLTADVSSCAADAAAGGASCTVNVGLTLKRDGRVLDQSNQQFQVAADTRTIAVPAVQLFEVGSVTVDTTGTGALEPGDTKTLVAIARDRSGIVVPGRSPTWTLVSGGVTVSTSGSLSVVAEGPAVVRVVLGGRAAPDVNLLIRPSSVASIDIAPVDTVINIGGTFTYRVTPRSAAGTALTGRTVTLATSSAAIATIAGNVATGVSAGLATITATSTQGRAGGTVTKTTTLRVLATPAIRVDRSAVTFDVPPAGTSTATSVVVTTDTGRTLRGLVSSVTYTPNVAPWLTQALAGTVTPTTLSLRAAAGALDTGTYVADVNLTSTDLHVPASVRVTMRVVRVVAAPRTVSFGPYPTGTAVFPPLSVALRTSLAAVPLSGLTVRTEYIGAVTGWLTAALQAAIAAPTTSVLLTPNPAGVPAGTSQARVIVTSASPVVSADTVVVSLTAGDPGRFSGLVVTSAGKLPVAGAIVTIRRTDNSIADQVTTSATGTWTSNQIVAGTYNVFVTAAGFLDYVLYAQVLVGGVTIPTTPLANTELVPATAGSGDITGSVRDAVTNNIVAAVTVELRAGANNTTGTPLATTTTNADGVYSFTARPNGTYTVRATKASYAAGSVTITLIGGSVSAPITFLSPGTATIAWRFVLSWGSTPLDLDAHLTGPLPATTSRFHVFYSARGSSTTSPFALLDQDSQAGYGPETITLHQQIAGIYRFFVVNFSGSPEMRTSTARVDVYQGNTLVQQFFPPQQSGQVWTLLEINGSVLTPINTINSTVPSVQVPASGFVRSNLRSERAMQDLMSFEPWTWLKPLGAIKKE